MKNRKVEFNTAQLTTNKVDFTTMLTPSGKKLMKEDFEKLKTPLEEVVLKGGDYPTLRVKVYYTNEEANVVFSPISVLEQNRDVLEKLLQSADKKFKIHTGL